MSEYLHRASRSSDEQEGALHPQTDTASTTRADLPRRTASTGLAGLPRQIWQAGNAALSRLLSRARSGQPLDPRTRAKMETTFGADMGRVRVHDDSAAQDAAGALDAEAFTRGQDIYLGADSPRPESEAGKRLLAHELAHVVQQRQAADVDKDGLSQPGDAFEQGADRAAAAVSAGLPAPVTATGTPPAVQRQEDPRKKQKQQALPPLIEGAAEKGIGVGSEGVSVGGVPAKAVGKVVKGDFKGAASAAQDPGAQKKDPKAALKKETQELRKGLEQWKPREKGPFMRPPAGPSVTPKTGPASEPSQPGAGPQKAGADPGAADIRVLERLDRNVLSPLEKVQRLERRIRRLPAIFERRKAIKDPQQLRRFDETQMEPEFGKGYVLGSLEDELARAQIELNKARRELNEGKGHGK